MEVAILVVLIIGLIVLLLFSWSIAYDVDRFQELNSRMLMESTELTQSLARQSIELGGLLVDSQETLDRKLDAVVRVVDQHSTFVNEQMRIIHSLVNSDLMAARRAELIVTKELRLTLERIVTSATLSRQQPLGQDVMTLEHIDKRINDLEAIIHEQII